MSGYTRMLTQEADQHTPSSSDGESLAILGAAEVSLGQSLLSLGVWKQRHREGAR